MPIYFIIVAFGWLAFGNAPDVGNSLNFLASLLLTMVSFKFTYRDSLPKARSPRPLPHLQAIEALPRRSTI